ncbi:MAG: hypothetical protein M5R41_13450 [Bacteroidia bacterium]|nr:hypothetical protein [Bacteroidia bacterium]
MKRLTQLSTRRDPDYDYSQPAKHLVVFKTEGDAEILGTTKNGVTTLSDIGRAFLDVLGQALQNFRCISIHELSIRPSEVELALEITKRRNIQEEPPRDSDEWVHYRRIMTLPVFMGYLKMNSAHRINELQGTSGGDVWARRYASCVLADEKEFAAVCAALREEWRHVVVSPASRRKEQRASTLQTAMLSEFGGAGKRRVKQVSAGAMAEAFGETMFLGRVLLLTGARRGGGAGGISDRSGTVIRNLGPGRIYLSE